MKPMILIMSAFGSFVQKETVDFTKLGDKGIFLITGETGAGKTTIFDAIMFALYGSTSGDSGDSRNKTDCRDTKNIRSDYADLSVKTFVDFTFMHKEKKYRIYRSPKQPYLTKKGTIGEKTADAVLYLPDGGVIDGFREVTTKITEILGIEQKDFCQLVMIAQGKFRDLLLAGNEKRGEIFRKIFSTEIYEQFAIKLKLQTKELLREYEEANASFVRALRDIEIPRENPLYDDFSAWKELKDDRVVYRGEELFPSIFESIEKDGKDLEKINIERKCLEENEKTLSVQYAQAVDMNESLKKLEECRRELEILKNREEEIYVIRRHLEQTAQAEEVKPYYENYKRSMQEYEEARDDLSKKEAQKQEYIYILEKEKSNYEATLPLEENLRKENTEVQILKDSLGKFSEIDSLLRQLEKIQTECKKAKLEYDKNNALLEKSKNEQIQNDRILEETKDCMVRLSNAQNKHERLTELLRRLEALICDAQNVKKEKNLYNQNQQEFISAKQVYEQKRTVYEHEESLFFSAQAGIIAEKLTEGKPCPVCGSYHHPQKAVKPSKVSSQAELDALREACEQAREILVKKSSICSANDASVKTLTSLFFQHAKELLGSEYSEDLRTVWHTIQLKKEAAQQDIFELNRQINEENKNCVIYTQAEAKKHQLSSNIEQLMQKESILIVQVSECEARYRENLASIKVMQSNLPFASKEELKQVLTQKEEICKKIKDKIESAQKQYSDAQAALLSAENMCEELRERCITAEQKRNTETEKYNLQLQKENWTEADFLAALLTKKEREELAQKAEEYQKQIMLLSEREQSLKQITKDADFSDVDTLQDKIEKAHTQREKIEELYRSLYICYERNCRCYNEAKAALQNIKPKREQYYSFKNLNDTVSGSLAKTAKISFESFVQAFYFDKVLQEANKRFHEMSGGQYALKRRKEPTSQQSKSGLELDVFDYYTGKVRPVQTLSGGESFMASLSLALGLSDVIQSQKGGIEIDTLFIDEGFGTLDGNTLEEAIHILNDLTAGDKLVGIISHVAELKERIDKKIIVKKMRSGSRVVFCGEE